MKFQFHFALLHCSVDITLVLSFTSEQNCLKEKAIQRIEEFQTLSHVTPK